MNQETRFEQLAQKWRRETGIYSMPQGKTRDDCKIKKHRNTVITRTGKTKA